MQIIKVGLLIICVITYTQSLKFSKQTISHLQSKYQCKNALNNYIKNNNGKLQKGSGYLDKCYDIELSKNKEGKLQVKATCVDKDWKNEFPNVYNPSELPQQCTDYLKTL